MMRIGLVGCGHIGTVHAYVLQQLTEAKLVDAALTATFDADPARAERVARHHGGEPAATLAELVAGVDVVWVCTWTAAHLEAVELAVGAGRPVFCEKPLGPDLDGGRAGGRRCSSGCPHQVGLVLRWSPVFQRAAEIIASGEYGRPMATVLRDDQYFPIQGFYGSTWRKDVAQAGGGTLIEHSIHDIDVLHWLLGDPVSVSARTASRFGHPGHRGHRRGDLRVRRRLGRAAHERVAPGAHPGVGPAPRGVLRGRGPVDRRRLSRPAARADQRRCARGRRASCPTGRAC